MITSVVFPRIKLLAITAVVGLFVFAGSLLLGQKANATDTSTFNAGYIISDPVFTNYNSMSAAQIQSFLDANNSVCLKSFQTLSLNDANGDGLGDEPYGKGIGEQVSAATLIWQASQLYKINPQVILATLQKEQGLITRTDCPDWRYNTALGYGCPDSAPCSTAAYGFTRQIDYGTWHFRGFFDDSYPIPPITPGARYIAYNPSSSCGGTTVTIQNRATAALYSYTPYQPNAATLAASLGQTVDCGAYGNINFWRYFTNWFGSTVNPHLNFSIIKTADSSDLYLQTSEGKYYIPSGDIMTAWGIQNLPVQVVTQTYLDSLTTGPFVGKLLKDDWENYFIVEGGTLHYIRDPSYLALWGLSKSDAVQSLGLSITLPSTTWVGRFIQDKTQPTSSYWLIDGGKKHPINDTGMLYAWRYTPDQLTTVSPTFLSSIPTDSNPVTPYASDGITNYLIDTGRKLSFNNSNTQSAYYGSTTPVTYMPNTLSYLPTEASTKFVMQSSNGSWFMLDGGKKHYIPNGALAELWGKPPSTTPTVVSDAFINTLPDAGTLAYVIQTANPSAYWIIDKNKHYIPDGSTAEAWLGEGVSPPVYSNEGVADINQSSDATTVISGVGSPYTYVMVDGSKHYLSTPSAKTAWGGSSLQTSTSLISAIPEGVFVNQLLQDSNGQAYLLVNSVKYPIDNNFKDVWGVNSSTITVSASTLSRYSTGSTLKAFIKIGNTSYVITGTGQKTPIVKYADTFNTPSLGEVVLPSDALSNTSEASYMIKSSDSSDQRVWFVNKGSKILLSFEQQVSLGYISRGIIPTTLSPATIALIPTSASSFSLLIQKTGSGIKLLNFGTSLGFSDGTTLTSYVGSAGILSVADSVFDSIAITGTASRVVTDDAGKYYLVQNGQRYWITNGVAYQPYMNISRMYLYGTTMSLITQGSPIN